MYSHQDLYVLIDLKIRILFGSPTRDNSAKTSGICYSLEAELKLSACFHTTIILLACFVFISIIVRSHT